MQFINQSTSFQQYNTVPPTPLLTSDVLKEENEQWPDVQQGMSLALREMRVDQVRVTVNIVKSRDKMPQ